MTVFVPWQPVGTSDQEDLVDARMQAHWGVQLLAAAADSLLPQAPDDSHTNVFWEENHSSLMGRDLGGVRVGLRLSDLSLLTEVAGKTTRIRSLEGSTLEDLKTALEQRLEAVTKRSVRLTFRNYEMPAHPVGRGAPFPAPDRAAVAELAAWYANGTAALANLTAAEARATEVAVWPHHFDLGGIVFIDPEAPADRAPQIGFGMSPGDNHLPGPYFYVTAWPISDTAVMDNLPAGRWVREGFTGAVLGAAEIGNVDLPDEQAARVDAFLTAAITEGEALIRVATS